MMAVEEVRGFTLPSHMIFLTFCYTKEFSIEIPDAEADEIQTVQQGTFLTRCPAAWKYQ